MATKALEGMSDDHRWLASQDLSQYLGMWIAVLDRKVIASGKTLRDVMEATRNLRGAPLYLPVPEGFIVL